MAGVSACDAAAELAGACPPSLLAGVPCLELYSASLLADFLATDGPPRLCVRSAVFDVHTHGIVGAVIALAAVA